MRGRGYSSCLYLVLFWNCLACTGAESPDTVASGCVRVASIRVHEPTKAVLLPCYASTAAAASAACRYLPRTRGRVLWGDAARAGTVHPPSRCDGGPPAALPRVVTRPPAHRAASACVFLQLVLLRTRPAPPTAADPLPTPPRSPGSPRPAHERALPPARPRPWHLPPRRAAYRENEERRQEAPTDKAAGRQPNKKRIKTARNPP